jgi:hypothetical protein
MPHISATGVCLILVFYFDLAVDYPAHRHVRCCFHQATLIISVLVGQYGMGRFNSNVAPGSLVHNLAKTRAALATDFSTTLELTPPLISSITRL